MIDIARRSLTCVLRAVVLCGVFQHGVLLVAQESPEKSTVTERAQPSPEQRQHWAFHKVTRPELPSVRNREWVRNQIDAFVLARFEERGVVPSIAADPRKLVRRACFDLTGLPPSPRAIREELDAAGAWRSDDAFGRVVEQLLASPAYGERWGRHWLDLVRYAETTGYEIDLIKPFVWRYRDYVVRAFNEDRSYDRLILEQLAGDELADADSEAVIATGFYLLGPWDAELAGQRDDARATQSRFDQLDDMVSTTCQVFLGLTMGCARCHDHKFEPLSTRDYYSLVAVFNTLTRPRAGRYGREGGRIELATPAGTPKQIEALAERDRLIAIHQRTIAQSRVVVLEQLFAAGKSKLPLDAVAAFRVPSGLRTAEERTLVHRYTEQLNQEIKRHGDSNTKGWINHAETWIRRRRDATPNLPRAYVPRELSPRPPVTHELVRGNVTEKGAIVEPAIPAVLVDSPVRFLAADKYTSRRRLTLARWIASPENPLTARVMVNRVWQHHFGVGLVRTPSDFGLQGQPPTHPKLLDWLADWFVHEGGWSLKSLHRLIMTSSTYRMSKVRRQQVVPEDPETLLLSRRRYRRLEAETIRDATLAVSGRLNQAMYGPGVYPYIPRTVIESNRDGSSAWMPFSESSASRRTVYTFVRRAMLVPMLEMLDVCDTTKTSPERKTSTVATQALLLLNGEFVNRQAGHFADRVGTEVGADTAARIDRAYLLALGRLPKVRERADLVEFVEQEVRQAIRGGGKTGPAADRDRARDKAFRQVCRLIFNLNEFVYTD